jgi:uncharacterized membrane protein
MRVVPCLLLALLLCGAVRSADPPEQLRPVRVLVVSSAASREYQFLRSSLARRGAERKITVTLALLSGDGKTARIVEQGDDKILTAFPDTFEPNPKRQSAEAALFNLASYDVIVALDPDWTKVKPEQQGLLRKWVEKGGGLIVLPGDIHTHALASPARRDTLKTISELYPVVLDDPRLRLLQEAAPNQPHRLTLTPAAKDAKYLRLGDEEVEKGWDTFYGQIQGNVPERGFYRAFPVVKIRDGATTLATWGKDQPYVVQVKVGDGQVVYVGSQELWRIRQARQDWYDTLWERMIRQTAGK